MVSPFFTGYKPGDEQEGWYAGRQMRGGGKGWGISPVPPYEFTSVMDDFDKRWDALAYMHKDIPKKILDEWKSQYKNLFKISGGYGDQLWVEADERMRDLAGDENEYMGSFDVSYNVNPVDWVKDPGGTLKQQLKDIYKSTFNWEDVERKADDDFINDVLLRPRASVIGTGSILDRLHNSALDSIRERVEQDTRKKTGSTAGSFDMRLTGRVIGYDYTDTKIPIPGTTSTREVRKPYDSGKRVASAAIATIRTADSPTKARGFYNGFVGASLQAMYDELTGMSQPQRDAFLANAATTMGLTGAESRFLFDTFSGNLAFASSISTFNAIPNVLLSSTIDRVLATTLPDPRHPRKLKRLAKQKVGLVGGAVVQTPIGTPPPTTAPGAPPPPPGPLPDQDLNDLLTQMKGIADGVDTFLGHQVTTPAVLGVSPRTTVSVDGHYSKMRAFFAAQDPTSAVVQEERRFFEQNFDEFEKCLSAFSNLKNTIEPGVVHDSMEEVAKYVHHEAANGNFKPLLQFNNAYTVFRKGSRVSIKGISRGVSKGLGEKDMFSGGILTSLYDGLARHYIIPKSTTNDRKLFLQVLLSDPTQANLSFSILGVHALVRDRFYRGWVKDVGSVIEGGKITSQLIKTRLFGMPLYALTPRGMAAHFLSRNHYFGLTVDPYTFEPYLEGKAYPVYYSFGNRWVHYLYKKGLLVNKFNLDFSVTSPGFGSVLFSVKNILGGKNLAAAGGLSYFLTIEDAAFTQYIIDAKNAQLSAKIADVVTRLGVSEKQALVVNFLKLNPRNYVDEAAYRAAVEGLFGGLGLGKLEQEAFVIRLSQFRRFLESRNLELGNLFTATGELDESKIEVLFGLLEAFEKRKANVSLLSYTRSAAGALELLTQRLNILFNELIKKGGIPGTNISISSFFFLKTRIKQKLINKLFARLGIALADLGGPLAFVLTYLATKFIDKLTKIGKHLVKFEFAAIAKMFEDTFATTLKYTSYISILILIPIVIIFALLAGIISNISPVEPYSYNNLEFGVTPGPAPPLIITPGACANSCIFAGGVSSQITSYTGNESGGHGSNNYWDNIPSSISRCGINIPTNGGPGAFGGSLGPTSSLDNAGDSVRNYCHDQPITTSFYGRAWDIIPSAGAGATVCAPAMTGVAYWKIGQSLGQSNGFMVDASGFNAADELVYTLRFIHLGSIVRTTDQILPGDSVGTVWNWGSNSHVHLELKDINNNIIAPETAGICAGS